MPRCVDVTVVYAHASAMGSTGRIKCPKSARNLCLSEVFGSRNSVRTSASVLDLIRTNATISWYEKGGSGMVTQGILLYLCISFLDVLISCTFIMAFRGGEERNWKKGGTCSAKLAESRAKRNIGISWSELVSDKTAFIENHMTFWSPGTKFPRSS